MKKAILLGCAVLMLGACVGFTEGRSKSAGKKTYDMYVLHPYITITGYTSQL
jgi:hypothetical protein